MLWNNVKPSSPALSLIPITQPEPDVQVKSPGGRNALCPYCKREFAVTFWGPKSTEERQQEKQDEQTVIEATIRAQREVGAGYCALRASVPAISFWACTPAII